MMTVFSATGAVTRQYLELLSPGHAYQLPRTGRALLIVPPGRVYHQVVKKTNGLYEITLNLTAPEGAKEGE